MKIEPGMYVVAINEMWRTRPPFNRGLEVISVGARVKLRVSPDGEPLRYKLLRPTEIIAAYPLRATADFVAEVAFDKHQELQKDIDARVETRNTVVCQILKSQLEDATNEQ